MGSDAENGTATPELTAASQGDAGFYKATAAPAPAAAPAAPAAATAATAAAASGFIVS